MMFNQNNEEKKLDWMYKGPNSLVEREEYLLGRSVDKTLEQLNEEEKHKQQGVAVAKNRVEHECIPPSIRDFNKVVQAEQVDLSAKLQEDPLVAIKKREEETRRQFLQNPVQLKKLQKALKAQQAKKNKKKKKKKRKSRDSDDSDSDLDKKLAEKLLGQKRKICKEERNLDTILIHKYEEFKDKLSESDLQDILNGKITDSEDSSEEEERPSKKSRKKGSVESENNRKVINNKKEIKRNKQKRSEISDSDDNSRYRKFDERTGEYKRKHLNQQRHSQNRISKYKSSSKHNEKNKYGNSSSDDSSDSHREKRDTKYYYSNRNDDDSDSPKDNKKTNYGLVNSAGEKIALLNKFSHKKEVPHKVTKAPESPPPVQKYKPKKLTEEEKERLRKEMMENAVWRDQERVKNVRKYNEKEEKERKEQGFDPEFIHKQLLKSADSSTIENRIKANLNNIQRSRGDMNRHFSKRE